MIYSIKFPAAVPILCSCVACIAMLSFNLSSTMNLAMRVCTAVDACTLGSDTEGFGLA